VIPKNIWSQPNRHNHQLNHTQQHKNITLTEHIASTNDILIGYINQLANLFNFHQKSKRYKPPSLAVSQQENIPEFF